VLQLFRNIDLSAAVIAFIYFWIFYTANFICPQPDLVSFQNGASAITNQIYHFAASAKFLLYLIPILSILWQSFLINALVNEFRLSKKATFVTVSAAYLIVFSFANNDFLNPFLLSNNFLCLSLWFLFRSADKKAGLAEVFNSSFLLGVASCFAWANFAYLPLFCLALLMFRGFEWRDLLVLIAGFLSPFLLLFTYFYINDKGGAWFSQDIGQHWAVADIDFDTNAIIGFVFGFWLLLAAYTLINFNGLQQKTTLKEQKYIQITVLMLLFGSLSFFMQQSFQLYSFNIYFIPLTILLSLNLQSIKSNNWAEIIHLAWLILIVAAQYGSLIFA